jgi:hypothetical protein
MWIAVVAAVSAAERLAFAADTAAATGFQKF